MSRTANTSDASLRGKQSTAAKYPTADRPLHRLRKVRTQEGVGLRAVARHLDTTMAEVKFQELENTDLPLSVLYKWQEALRVPMRDLLGEPSENVSAPLMFRARLVRVMKTATTLLQRSEDEATQRMARVMVNQLLEIMPELRDIGPWQLVGKRRGKHEYGRAADRCMPEEMFTERMD